MRVDESWQSNASESCNSHQLSSSFDWALNFSYSDVLYLRCQQIFCKIYMSILCKLQLILCDIYGPIATG